MADLDPVQGEEGVEGEAVAGGGQRPAPERTAGPGGDGVEGVRRADRVGSGLVAARVVATGLGAIVLVCSLWAGERLVVRAGGSTWSQYKAPGDQAATLYVTSYAD